MLNPPPLTTTMATRREGEEEEVFTPAPYKLFLASPGRGGKEGRGGGVEDNEVANYFTAQSLGRQDVHKSDPCLPEPHVLLELFV